MDRIHSSARTDTAGQAAAPVWVLEDPRAGTAAQTLGLAERLGLPHRAFPLAWRWSAHLVGLRRFGSLSGLAAPARRPLAAEVEQGQTPSLVLSAGRRSAAVALWLREATGARLVHCMSPGLGGLFRRDRFDLLVSPSHDDLAGPNVLPVLTAPHRLSPQVLAAARAEWMERLAHLPRPRIALLVGGRPRGGSMPPWHAQTLAREVARMALREGGSVLATTSRRTGPDATEALAAGLGPCLHLLYRWGEPGPNPYLGYLALADAIVVTSDSVAMLSEACATDASVFAAVPALAGRRQARLIAALAEAGQVRPFSGRMERWHRTPLDEAARVATEIRLRIPLA